MISKKILSKLKLLGLVIIVIMQVGCSSLGFGGGARREKGTQIVNYAKRYIGTPYVYGGTNLSKGVDCSGLAYVIYKRYGISLSRVSKDMAKNGRGVWKSNLEIGDLVFFDTKGWNTGRVTHMGIYIKDGYFIHASESQGVMISNLNSGYWKKKYAKGRRVIK